MLQYCFSAVSILFRNSTSIAPVLFQCCSNTVPVLFQFCTSTTPILCQYCSNTVPVLLQYCFSAVPILLKMFQYCCSAVSMTLALVFSGKCWFREVTPTLGMIFCIGLLRKMLILTGGTSSWNWFCISFIKKLLIERGGAHTWNWLLHWFCQENVDSKRRCCLLELTFVPRPFLRISLPKLEVTRNITCKLSQRSSNLTKKHQAKD